MKKVFVLLTTLLLLCSCSEEYDDAALTDRVDNLENRVSKLEELCKQMNTNISSLQTLVAALEENDYVTGITPVTKDGKEVGYTLTFNKSKPITIYHGKDGADGEDGKEGTDGEDGKDGLDGTNGTDGKDGVTPTIGVEKATDGIYYWTLNGEWLLDSDGNKVKATGTDGKDGTDGSNGTPATLPRLKTGAQLIADGVSGAWEKTGVYITVDGGTNWTKISATDDSSIFSGIDITQEDCITFTLADGSTFSLPRTDQTLALLLGTWTEASCERYSRKFTFNADYSYKTVYKDESIESHSGIFELYPQSNTLVLNGNRDSLVWNVVHLSDEILILSSNNSHISTYYKNYPVTLETEELTVPAEGGTYQIGLTAEVPVTLEKILSSEMSSVTTTQIYAIPSHAGISFSYTYSGDKIEINVTPASACSINPGYIEVFDAKKHCLARLTIHQEGINSVYSPELTEAGIAMVKTITSDVAAAIFNMRSMDWAYTGMIGYGDFKAPLSPNNSILSDNFNKFYTAISHIDYCLEASNNEIPEGPLYGPMEVLRSLCYYYLGYYWNNIYYGYAEDIFYIPQVSFQNFSGDLIGKLRNAMNTMEEKKNVNHLTGESVTVCDDIRFSKDVARILLAKIYMYLGYYQDAAGLLKEVVDNGYYQLESTIGYGAETNNESILSFINNGGTRNSRASSITITSTIPVFTYSDVLLSLAECEAFNNGEQIPKEFTSEYLKQVIDKKNIQNSPSDFKEALNNTYQKTLWECGGYFIFLKRTGMAKEKLGLEDYQLVFPLPQYELNMNPNVTQNPGY